MKITRKIAIFGALMSLFLSISLIQSTYAKYVTSATNNANLTIARWNILVNDQDVVSNSNFVNNITPVFAGTQNIRSGVIAPTATGYFDITIDATDTDVSLQYSISLGNSTSNTVTDLEIYSYEIDGIETAYSDDITGSIIFDDFDKTKTIRFYVRWADGTGENMDNSADTAAANAGTAAIQVDINFSQIRD